MYVQFATCDPKTALEYIQQVLPSKDISEESIPLTLGLIGRDVIRVQDPMMYGNRIAIVPGNNHTDELADEINEAMKELQ